MNIEIAIQSAYDKFLYLEDLNKVLAFPTQFSTGHIQAFPLPSDLYENVESSIIDANCPIIVGLARKLDRFIDTYKQIDSITTSFVIHKALHSNAVKSMGPVNDIALNIALQERVMLYEFVSIMNYGTSITLLLNDAKCGNEDSLMKLVKIDKSVLCSSWAARILNQRQYAADWRFFKRLAYWIQRDPVDKGAGYPIELLIVALYWDEYFSKRTLTNTVEVLKPYCLTLRDTNDYETFRRKLNRAGLKKRRYNVRIRQLKNDRPS